MNPLDIRDIRPADVARLMEPLILLARAHHFNEWADALAAATLIDRVEVEVLQYAADDADELQQIRFGVEAAEQLRDDARLSRQLEHLARFLARWPLDELSAVEADLFLGFKPSGTRQAIHARRLPGIRRGRMWFVKLDNLITYAAKRRKRRIKK